MLCKAECTSGKFPAACNSYFQSRASHHPTCSLCCSLIQTVAHNPPSTEVQPPALKWQPRGGGAAVTPQWAWNGSVTNAENSSLRFCPSGACSGTRHSVHARAQTVQWLPMTQIIKNKAFCLRLQDPSESGSTAPTCSLVPAWHKPPSPPHTSSEIHTPVEDLSFSLWFILTYLISTRV